MLEVKVSTKVTRPQYQVFETIVKLYGFDSLTPRAARAALEAAGYNTGEAWTMAQPKATIYNVSANYGGDEACTPDELIEMCKELGWDVPELFENQTEEGRYWRDRKTGEIVLREKTELDYSGIYGYRVYDNTARKIHPQFG